MRFLRIVPFFAAFTALASAAAILRAPAQDTCAEENSAIARAHNLITEVHDKLIVAQSKTNAPEFESAYPPKDMQSAIDIANEISGITKPQDQMSRRDSLLSVGAHAHVGVLKREVVDGAQTGACVKERGTLMRVRDLTQELQAKLTLLHGEHSCACDPGLLAEITNLVENLLQLVQELLVTIVNILQQLLGGVLGSVLGNGLGGSGLPLGVAGTAVSTVGGVTGGSGAGAGLPVVGGAAGVPGGVVNTATGTAGGVTGSGAGTGLPVVGGAGAVPGGVVGTVVGAVGSVLGGGVAGTPATVPAGAGEDRPDTPAGMSL